MKSMGDYLMRAVVTKAKQTSKLVDRIRNITGVVGFFMRIPIDTNAGKIQMAAALVTASRHVLDRTTYDKFDKAKFYVSFAKAENTFGSMTVKAVPRARSAHDYN